MGRKGNARHKTFGMPFSGSYRMTQGFGPSNVDAEPAFGPYKHYHNGMDYECPGNTPILAVAAGVVSNAGWGTGGWDPNWGNLVAIDHGSGLVSFYAHLASFGVGQGAHVTRGMQIGVSDSTGNSTGNHLHFGVTRGGSFVDPAPYLDGTASANVAPDAQLNPTTGRATLSQVVYWARAVGIPETQLAVCAAICQAESSLQIDIENEIGACGLWQILHSAHPTYDKDKLLHDPVYNAQAMADISGKGTDWHWWVAYAGDPAHGVAPGAYKTYLTDARKALAATPPGSVPAGTSGTSSGTQNLPDYVDTSPQLPVNRYRIAPVQVAPTALATIPGAEATGLLWVAGHFLPLQSGGCTLTTYLQPGSFKASSSLDWLQRPAHHALLERLLAREATQVVLYLGYRPPGADYSATSLAAMFTGLLEESTFDYGRMTLELGGPDMTGVFSDASATLSSLSDSQQNMTASDLVRHLVRAHNAKGSAGLRAVVEKTDDLAGEVLGPDVVSTRTAGQTEWDVLTSLAQMIGYVLYASGTTIHFRRLPTMGAPQDLYWRSQNVLGPITGVRVEPQPHSKRDYQIQVSSYHSKDGSIVQARAGNSDSPTIISLSLPPNTPKKQVLARADHVLARYNSTEVLLHLDIMGAIPLSPFAPVRLHSDIIWKGFCAPQEFYPAGISYDFDAEKGISMTASCTSRPPGIQTQAQTAEITDF